MVLLTLAVLLLLLLRLLLAVLLPLLLLLELLLDDMEIVRGRLGSSLLLGLCFFGAVTARAARLGSEVLVVSLDIGVDAGAEEEMCSMGIVLTIDVCVYNPGTALVAAIFVWAYTADNGTVSFRLRTLTTRLMVWVEVV